MTEYLRIDMSRINYHSMYEIISFISKRGNVSRGICDSVLEEMVMFYDNCMKFLTNHKIVFEDKTGKLKVKCKIDSELIAKKKIADCLFDTKNSELWEFISIFSPYNDYYSLVPSVNDNIKHFHIRRLLTELGVIEVFEDGYLIKNQEIIEKIVKKKTSIEELHKILEDMESKGLEAEKYVLALEKTEIKKYPDIVIHMGNIRQVSIHDCSAGYDLISFSREFAKENIYEPIYIEVKSVSDRLQHFYMTSNEINTAKLLRHKYFLYLCYFPLPEKASFDNITIISNPYVEVYKGSKWNQKNERILFWRKENEDDCDTT